MKTIQTDKNKIYALCLLIIFLAGMAALSAIFAGPILSFVADAVRFRRWVQQKGLWSRIIFIFLLVLQIIIAFIPGEAFELAAGYAFGRAEGTLLCLIGSVIGSFIVFSAVRVVGVKLLHLFFSQEEIDRVYRLSSSKRFNRLVFLVFFIPGTPKDILSYFVGLSKMQFSQWLFISTLAKIPSIVTSTVAGSLVGDANYSVAGIVFCVTAVISVAGMYFYNSITENKTAVVQ